MESSHVTPSFDGSCGCAGSDPLPSIHNTPVNLNSSYFIAREAGKFTTGNISNKKGWVAGQGNPFTKLRISLYNLVILIMPRLSP